MKSIRLFCVAAAITSLAVAAGPGYAAVISDSTPYEFSWSYNTGSTILSGSGSMKVSGFGTYQLAIETWLSNTSAIGGIGGERLTHFGFGIDPDATAVSFLDVSDGGMVSAGFAFGALPANVQGVEICARGGPNCAGGSNGGIYAGAADTFTILLTGTWGDSVNIAPIGFKYQTGYGSFEFPLLPPTSGPPVEGPPSNGPPTGTAPEPGTLALLGLGLAGLAARRRRKQ